jgi:hypothetical protein
MKGDSVRGGYRRAIKESFENFVWPMAQKDSVEQVWIIGRGVGKALNGVKLNGMPHRITKRWIISQPNDWHRHRYRRDLKRLIRNVCVC